MLNSSLRFSSASCTQPFSQVEFEAALTETKAIADHSLDDVTETIPSHVPSGFSFWLGNRVKV